MKASELPDDPAVWGGVVLGDLEDDGQPVACETLALALEAWRGTRDLWRCLAVLHAARPGEPWEDWTEAALDAWREAAALRPLLLAAAIAAEASRAELREIERALREAEKVRARLDAAGEVSAGAVRLLEEVLGG